MTSKRWKSVEQYYCEALGGKRRGAQYTSDSGTGMNDCRDCGYSAEIRHRKTVTFSMVREQVDKARERAEEGQIPISIIHTPGMRLNQGIVSMQWEDFVQWFVSPVRRK